MKKKISFELTFLHFFIFYLLPGWARKVFFDENYVYFSRSGRTNTIELEKIIEVKRCIFPFRIYFLNTYIITISYFEKEVKKKIRFFSKGTLRTASVRGIPHIDQLRKNILTKKYNKVLPSKSKAEANY